MVNLASGDIKARGCRGRSIALASSAYGQEGAHAHVRAGYISAPTEADWTMMDREVLGGPNARLTGPYI